MDWMGPFSRLPESHSKISNPQTKTQPTTEQPPLAPVATTVQATTAPVAANLLTTQSSGMTGQLKYPAYPSAGTLPAVSAHQASQRPSSALKCSGQALLSGQPAKKVQVLASGIEAITTLTDASQPVVVTIACTVIPAPSQPPQAIFQSRSTSTWFLRIIGTIHHPVVNHPPSILSQAASEAGIGPGARVGPGMSTATGGGIQLPPTTEPFSILPSLLISQEDEDIQILTDLPNAQRVYMVVGDDDDDPPPPALVTHVKREKTEATNPARGSSCGATLPAHLRRGGSSRTREVEEEDPDNEEDDKDDEEGEGDGAEPPTPGASKESQEAPTKWDSILPEWKVRMMITCMTPQDTSKRTSSSSVT